MKNASKVASSQKGTGMLKNLPDFTNTRKRKELPKETVRLNFRFNAAAVKKVKKGKIWLKQNDTVAYTNGIVCQILGDILYNP